MAKRKKSSGDGNPRRAFDNPLAAARSGKATTTSATKQSSAPLPKNHVSPESSAIEPVPVEFGTAREQKNRNKNSQNDAGTAKRNRKAEQIWHRRSGAGFRLFVDYYLGQPEGIVAIDLGAPSGQPEQAAASAPSSAGQSRAALRRKKKKRKTSGSRSANGTGTNAASTTRNTTDAFPGAAAGTATAPGPLAGGSATTISSSLSSTTITTTSAVHANLAVVPRHQYDSLLYRGRLLEVLAATEKSLSDTTANDRPSTAGISPGIRQFLTALSKPLPLTFRFRHYDSDGGDAPEPTNRILARRRSKIAGLKRILMGPTLAEGGVASVPFDASSNIYQALPVLRGSRPWALDKASLGKVHPRLKEFLNAHTRDGTIARQELGSMLPVWLLQKLGALSSPRIRVLDLCASPGSKTLQAAELVVGKGGRVRANDVNANRLETLREAVYRSGVFGRSGGDCNSDNDSDNDSESFHSVDEVVRYSNVDASRYPIPKQTSKLYPVILCDVPCSGDGTCRKDVHVIPNWTPSISNALHSLQVKILARAMLCVAVGGYVSYSTCSLNPIEDEAVVAAAFESFGKDSSGKSHRGPEQQQRNFELVPFPESLRNGLVLRPGVKSWRVAGFDPSSEDAAAKTDVESEEPQARLRWYDSYESAAENRMEGAVPSMWPGTGANKLPLDRCLRLFPQDQDTGGFFVALIRRTK
ncbi:unnamed protein product [Pseudo-nitzschia multistriata]|uniref:SAM-dependent MTase RsmB/NOP-type domain-containing protein n=1 Tax=Pseudo-nitzschia multistriata TaxID=183589 RepID=A0A448Z9B0_9STRA|nr:unnamed protein product [Pseudo-nitzschia multistriata]